MQSSIFNCYDKQKKSLASVVNELSGFHFDDLNDSIIQFKKSKKQQSPDLVAKKFQKHPNTDNDFVDQINHEVP